MSVKQLATIVDFNGSIGVRLGSRQLQPYIIIYSKHRDCLDWLYDMHPEFSHPVQVNRKLHMIQVISLRGVKKILDDTLPYLQRLDETGEIALKFCNSRLDHPTVPYSLGELQMIRNIIIQTSRPSAIKRRLTILEKWK